MNKAEIESRMVCSAHEIDALGQPIKAPSFATACTYCWGSGKIKAMQRAMTYDAGSIRVGDIEVKCIYCNGTGRKDDK